MLSGAGGPQEYNFVYPAVAYPAGKLLGSFDRMWFCLAALYSATFHAGSAVEGCPELCHQPGLVPTAPSVPTEYQALQL